MTPPHSRRTVLKAGAATTIGVARVSEALSAVRDTAAALPTSTAARALATSSSCTTLTAQETEGPFWVDERLHRSDITGGQAGVRLTFTMTLLDAGGSCAPQQGAYVDVWHANAQGVYSDESVESTVGQTFLRGYQVSDANGQVTFTTIWPGWYSGRTIHIHFRVRTTLSDSSAVNFTSQLYFDETDNAAVLATSHYARSGSRDTTNASDNIYESSLLMPVTGSPSAGYAGAFTVNLDFGDGAGSSAGTGSSDTVSASLVSAAVRRVGRRRYLTVHLHAGERVTGRVRLLRHDDVLAHRRWGWLARGNHALRLKVPRGVAAGSAKVLVHLADTDGNSWSALRRVHVPG